MSYPIPDPNPPCPESRKVAQAMLACLPDRLRMPELGCDPDGQTNMDWQRDRNNVVSVSVGTNGKLAVAWISEKYGTGLAVMEFRGQWPKVLLDIIRLIYPV